MRKIFDVVALEDKERSTEDAPVWLGMCLTPVPIVKYVDSDGRGFELFIGTLPPVEGTDKFTALRNVEYQITQHFAALRSVFSEIEFDKIMVGI